MKYTYLLSMEERTVINHEVCAKRPRYMSRTQILQQDERSLGYLLPFLYMIQRLRDVCLEEISYSPPNSPMEHQLLVLVLYCRPFPDQTISTSMTLMA